MAKSKRKLDLDQFDLIVDQDAEPFDEDQFLDALDKIVERRLTERKQAEQSLNQKPPEEVE